MGQFGQFAFGSLEFGEKAKATGTVSTSATVKADGPFQTGGQFGEEQFGVNRFGETSEFARVASISTLNANVAASTTAPDILTQATITGTGLGSERISTINTRATLTANKTQATAAVDLGSIWRVKRAGTVDTDLYNVEVVITGNPFGDYAIAYLDDTDGDKFDQYTRGTEVEFQVSTNGGANYTTRFTGYVVEAREQDEQGADSLEVECYSFDQFLRRDTVSNDQTGNTISEALEDIITNDTPVTFDANNVEVEDDQTLTRSYRGERVENVLLNLRSISGGEDFGVNDSLEFFFRPFESESAPRNIDNSQWFDYDIPEEGKETINEVTVFYDSGTKSVTVDDGGDKTELQNNLSTANPITLAEEVSRPNITEVEDATDVADQILNDRETTLTGTVTTYGLIDASPGDVININIVPRGIDDNFRIAAIQYKWGADETILTIVEQKGDQDELLVRLSDSVKRIETQDVDRDGTNNRITDTGVGVTLPVSGSVDSTDFTAAKVTNNLRNQLRDGWIDGTTVSVADIAVGDGTSTPSRSDTALENELERTSVSESFPDSQSVLYEGSVSETDVSEVGLFDGSNNLLARATVDGSFSGTQDIDVRIDVENDTSKTGVVTLTGQTAVRDILADNSPLTPTDYAYGSDGTDPTESDTSLGTQEVSRPLDEPLVQTADSNSEFDELLSLSNTDPVVTQNSNIETTKTAIFREAENFDRNNDGRAPTSGEATNWSAQDGRVIEDTNDNIEWDFTFDHRVPNDNVEVAVRVDAFDDDGGTSNEVEWYLTVENVGQELIDTFAKGTSFDEVWFDVGSGDFQGGSQDGWTLGDIPAGATVTLEAVVTDGGTASQSVGVDVVVPYDGRFNITQDNTTDGNNALSGPEEYPLEQVVTFSEVSTRRELDEARCEQTWNDTSNNQFIELSNDGGNNFIRTNNSQTATATFNSATSQLQAQIGISRFTSDATTSPTNGDSGQTVDVHNLFANIQAITPEDIGVANIRSIVEPGAIVGTTLREAGELDTNGDLLTRSTFAEFTVESNQRVISSESFSWTNA